jgi:carbonic anhydrase/acetyltransferase-like protein (isoleucine patch superfamily)
MIIEHESKSPRIDPTAYVAPTATICGDVTIGPNARILFGAAVIAEGGAISIGEACIVMENAVVRSTSRHSTTIGAHCLIGPQAHVVGCSVEDCVFIATGASIFHGAVVGQGSEVRINGVIHIRTVLSPGTTVPIGWIAVGNPAQCFPPDQHDAIWELQEPLNFPHTVYGIERGAGGVAIMPEITRRLAASLASHEQDTIVEGTIL